VGEDGLHGEGILHGGLGVMLDARKQPAALKREKLLALDYPSRCLLAQQYVAVHGSSGRAADLVIAVAL
jgi:hypothetical protein